MKTQAELRAKTDDELEEELRNNLKAQAVAQEWRDEMLRRILLKLVDLEKSISFIFEKVQR